jgi:predicted aspartyl protease
MGRFSVALEVENYNDIVLSESGQIDSNAVRSMHIDGIVNSGATRLVLPSSVARKLGLPVTRRTRTRYTHGRTALRNLVGAIQVTLQGRSQIFDAVVEPNRDKALIGAIVLEVLDFVVDCTAQRLVPRDPRVVISELE